MLSPYALLIEEPLHFGGCQRADGAFGHRAELQGSLAHAAQAGDNTTDQLEHAAHLAFAAFADRYRELERRHVDALERYGAASRAIQLDAAAQAMQRCVVDLAPQGYP